MMQKSNWQEEWRKMYIIDVWPQKSAEYIHTGMKHHALHVTGFFVMSRVGASCEDNEY